MLFFLYNGYIIYHSLCFNPTTTVHFLLNQKKKLLLIIGNSVDRMCLRKFQKILLAGNKILWEVSCKGFLIL